MNGDQAKCRVLGHNWDYTTVTEQGRWYIQGLICVRCKTTRKWKVNKRSGQPGGNQYKHSDGYLVEGGFSPKDKAGLRLSQIRDHL